MVPDIVCMLIGRRKGRNNEIILQEHIPLICYTVAQLLIILFIYWFDGYPHILTALYSVFLGVLLMGYLIYRYYSHRSFYKRLSTPMEALNESIKDSDLTPYQWP